VASVGFVAIISYVYLFRHNSIQVVKVPSERVYFTDMVQPSILPITAEDNETEQLATCSGHKTVFICGCFTPTSQAQYIFLYDAILEGTTSRGTEIPVEGLSSRMKELELMDREGETGYRVEFNVSMQREHLISVHYV
jgi:hypothetical protein